MEAANKAAVVAMHIGATAGLLAKNIVTESNDNIKIKMIILVQIWDSLKMADYHIQIRLHVKKDLKIMMNL